MKKEGNTKQMLFEMMRKVNPDFILKEDFQAALVEDDRSSYNADLVNDITTLLGNRPSLSPQEIQQMANDYQVGPDEITQTMQYVLTTKKDAEQPLPANSTEAEEVNDFFKFLENNPQKESMASLQYISKLDRSLAKPKTNPMVGRFLKLTKYMFRWDDTYKAAVERTNPDWEIQQRKGDYTNVEGFSVVKRDKQGDEVVDIIPQGPKSIILVLDENGGVVDKVLPKDMQEKYGEFFQPSFFTPYTGGSGTPFRALKLYAINRLAAGGKVWDNNNLKPEFVPYRGDFEAIPKT